MYKLISFISPPDCCAIWENRKCEWLIGCVCKYLRVYGVIVMQQLICWSKLSTKCILLLFSHERLMTQLTCSPIWNESVFNPFIEPIISVLIIDTGQFCFYSKIAGSESTFFFKCWLRTPAELSSFPHQRKVTPFLYLASQFRLIRKIISFHSSHDTFHVVHCSSCTQSSSTWNLADCKSPTVNRISLTLLDNNIR